MHYLKEFIESQLFFKFYPDRFRQKWEWSIPTKIHCSKLLCTTVCKIGYTWTNNIEIVSVFLLGCKRYLQFRFSWAIRDFLKRQYFRRIAYSCISLLTSSIISLNRSLVHRCFSIFVPWARRYPAPDEVEWDFDVVSDWNPKSTIAIKCISSNIKFGVTNLNALSFSIQLKLENP